MENEFLEPGKKNYQDHELIGAMGPYLTTQSYWKDIKDFGVTIEVGTPLYDSNKNHAGDVVKVAKKKCLVKLLKPVSLFALYSAGIPLKSIVFDIE